MVGDDLALADAFATALMVTGEGWPQVAGVRARLLGLIVTGDGRTLATPQFPIAA